MLRAILQALKKDHLQAQALDECHRMLDMCERMVPASVESLRQRDDATVDLDIPEMDKRINAFERDVRRKVTTHLSLGNRADINAGLVLVSVVVDIERIGDYSKNIYDLARMHPTRLHGGPIEEGVASVERQTLELLHRASQAFQHGGLEDASRLMREYKDQVSRACRDLERGLVTGTTVVSATQAAALALYLRFLKRIAAHSRNLASSVVNPFDRIGYPE